MSASIEKGPSVLTVRDLASMRLSTRTVYGLLKRGKLPGARRIGNVWRVDRDVFVAWLRGDQGVGIK